MPARRRRETGNREQAPFASGSFSRPCRLRSGVLRQLLARVAASLDAAATLLGDPRVRVERVLRSLERGDHEPSGETVGQGRAPVGDAVDEVGRLQVQRLGAFHLRGVDAACPVGELELTERLGVLKSTPWS